MTILVSDKSAPQVSDEEIIFEAQGNHIWESREGITVKVGPDLTEVIYHREFDDMMDVLNHIQKICGKRPQFTIDDYTANNGISMELEKREKGEVDADDDKPKTC